jgi:hypothetical protein
VPKMATPTTSGTSAPLVSDRLSTQRYNADDCLAAIRGERVPFALGLPLIRLCVIRGIRYHTDFAKDLYGNLPEFTRALNARMIMSNVIPDMDDAPEDEIPYCIWHPDVASQSTYRRLVQRFPQMAYQVARACAVAGYTDLYLELDVLPDVHVAEEARECGSTAIFSHIMAAPIRYTVMNDYTRTVDRSSAKPADLNGDTSVRWMLDVKQEFTHADVMDDDDFGLFHTDGFEENYFNITEDMNIGEEEEASRRMSSTFDVTPLLTSPLPLHLPTVDKDLLILMAAYYGDIDRYTRLRRPMMIKKEVHCCVHGIYHNTLYAVWWSKQKRTHQAIETAVNARFLMNNVLAPITRQNPSSSLPTVISNPTLAHTSTYRALAKYEPSMVPQILDACVIGNITDLFDELIAKINKSDLEHIIKTRRFTAPHFREVVERRMEELGCSPVAEGTFIMIPDRNLAYTSVCIPERMNVDLVQTCFSSSFKAQFMNGVQCDVSKVELLACLPDDWKRPEGSGHIELDYIEWPPNWEAKESP